MSLQVWLPLTGDLTQQGLSGVEVTNNGAVVNNDGKLGKCYQFSNNAIYGDFSGINSMEQMSGSCWVYLTSLSGAQYFFHFGGQGSYPCKFSLDYEGSIRSIINGTEYVSGITLTINTWYHLTVTFNGNIVKWYVNGEEKAFKTVMGTFSASNHFAIGSRTNSSAGTAFAYPLNNGRMNDVRIYDHCLSIKEVKELSKGLVLHYKFNNNGYGPSNLLLNGFGELGTTNWGNVSGVTTTDLPSADSNIKAKFKDTTSQEYIPIYRNHTYKISLYVKAASTSGNNYPSIKAYDIDKNEIQNYQEPTGFNLNTMTTLTQELKAGDTKIYVANLSNWNANSGHNYNYAAIFDYVDSTGYKYPIGTYTRITPAFGSGTTAKTNLDKTNNIITLNTAYSGKTISVGTSVCASTVGGTYYYPLGGIANSTVQNWTFKETTFSSEANRLKYAKYMRFYAYSNAYYAGITISDQNMINNVEWDCSGYKYNGNMIGTLKKYLDTPKYDISTYFYSLDPTTNSSTGLSYIEANFGLTAPIQMSVCWWAKPENGYGGSTTHAAWCTSASSAPTDYNSTAFHHRDGWFDICLNSASTTSIHLNMSYTKNEWHYYCVTYDGKIAKLYKDGIFSNQVTVSSTDAPLKTFSKLFIGYSRAGGVWRKTLGFYSDFRIYVTALSAEDITELYHTAASVDNHSNVYAGEIKEV